MSTRRRGGPLLLVIAAVAGCSSERDLAREQFSRDRGCPLGGVSGEVLRDRSTATETVVDVRGCGKSEYFKCSAAGKNGASCQSMGMGAP